MFANPLNVLGILQGTKVFCVPIYQRRYSWSAPEWNSLWDDLEFKLQEKAPPQPGPPHFLGNIVVQSINDPASTVVKYLVIDGQQRLTTILVLLAALRDARKAVNPKWNPDGYNNKYLVNPYDPEAPDRLVPTEFDRLNYISTVRNGVPTGGIGRAYIHFSRKLRTRSEAQLEEIANTVLMQFVVIFVETDEMDPVNTIFNTLNSKGRPLLPPDLIRNEIFMYLDPEKSDDVYKTKWLPIERALVSTTPSGNIKTNDFTTFFWSREVPSNPKLSKKMLYNAFESRNRSLLTGLDAAGKADVVMQEVAAIWSDFELFTALRNPHEGHLTHLRVGPAVEKALIDLDRWGSDTHVPVALWVLKGLRSERLSPATAAFILKTALSFMITRALSGIPTNTLSRLLSSLPAVLEKSSVDNVEDTLLRELGKPGYRWPSPEEAGLSLKTYGWDFLTENQRVLVGENVGVLPDLDEDEIADRLRNWLVPRPGTSEEAATMHEDAIPELLFDVLQTLLPQEFTTEAHLAKMLRIPSETLRSLLRRLEAPLLELVRTEYDKPVSVFAAAHESATQEKWSDSGVSGERRVMVTADDFQLRLSGEVESDILNGGV